MMATLVATRCLYEDWRSCIPGKVTVMSISEREQQALAFIERDLADTGPELAAKLVIFARLAAGEEMPPRETVRLPARASAARPPASPPLRLGSDRPRRPRGLRRRTALWLLMLVLTIVFLTLAVTFSRGGGKGICTASTTAACQHTFTPGQSGAGDGS